MPFDQHRRQEDRDNNIMAGLQATLNIDFLDAAKFSCFPKAILKIACSFVIL